MKLITLIAAASIAVQPAIAKQCPFDQSSLEVQGLRSELMVLATGCHEDARYNATLRRYQPALQANERAISAAFRAQYGRAGQTQQDRFVTDLANARSESANHMGADFCGHDGLIFNEMAAVQPADLAAYAAGKQMMPRAIVPACLQFFGRG